jgi:hypothetical protein
MTLDKTGADILNSVLVYYHLKQPNFKANVANNKEAM